MVAISLLQFRPRPILTADNAATESGATMARHGELLLAGARCVVIGEFCTGRDVAPGGKRVCARPPQVRITAVVALAVGLADGQHQVRVVGHSDGVDVAVMAVTRTGQELMQFAAPHQAATDPRHHRAGRDRRPSEQALASDLRRTNLGGRMQPAIAFRYRPHALTISRRNRPRHHRHRRGDDPPGPARRIAPTVGRRLIERPPVASTPRIYNPAADVTLTFAASVTGRGAGTPNRRARAPGRPRARPRPGTWR